MQVTATWTGAGGKALWNIAANGSTPNFPNHNTPAGTTYNVVIDGNSGATANVALNVIVAIDALMVNSGDSLAFNNARQITVVNSGDGTGTIVNSGTIALNSTGASTDLIINGNVTLSGGTNTLGNNVNNRIYGAAAINRLTNVDNTIQGAGQIGANFMALTNQGTIVANQSNALTIDVTGANDFTTAGTVQVLAGSTLVMSGDNFNQSAGRTSVNGNVSVNGNIQNAGTVAPGTSPGSLTINGNYAQTAAGTLLIEIGGPTVGSEFDRLAVTGISTFAGTPSVDLLGSYTPATGTNFQIVNYASRVGMMTLNVIDADSRGGFTQNHNVTNLTLTAAGPDFGVVTNTNNAGPGSLRQVILDTNAQANVGGPDDITFDIPAGDAGCDSAGVCTIAPTAVLPDITEAVVIDGYTQSGATPNTNPVGQGLNTVLKIQIDGRDWRRLRGAQPDCRQHALRHST